MDDKACATCRHWTGPETVKGTNWCGQLRIYVNYMFACKAHEEAEK